MKNDIFYNMSDKEKIMLFDLAIQTSKENNTDFEKSMESVIQAFLISKDREQNMTPNPGLINQETFDMNMAPNPEFINQEPFDMNMAPNPEFINQESLDTNMVQKKDEDFKSSTDTYGGPNIEQIDTKKTDYDNSTIYF